jgi:hypothetical protein
MSSAVLPLVASARTCGGYWALSVSGACTRVGVSVHGAVKGVVVVIAGHCGCQGGGVGCGGDQPLG